MKHLLLTSMAIGALIAAFTPEPIYSTVSRTLAADTNDSIAAENSSLNVTKSSGEATPRVEYLMHNGKAAYRHSDLGFVSRRPDAKVWEAAIHVGCAALMGGGLRCR